MKIKLLLVSAALVATLFVGCGNNQKTTTTDKEATTTETKEESIEETTKETIDAVTSASIVDKEADFEKAISKDGTWIIAALNDLTFDKELVVEGEFNNNKNEQQRKIALYTQDEDRTVTNRFTLTALKLTIKSPKASIQHGTFKGDLYIETTDFELVDAKVDGNIYFISEEAKAGFTMDAESSVTGTQEVTK